MTDNKIIHKVIQKQLHELTEMKQLAEQKIRQMKSKFLI